jgi:hypothetical protein
LTCSRWGTDLEGVHVESVSLVARKSRGFEVSGVRCYAIGAIRKATKATASKPVDEQRHYYLLHLVNEPDETDDVLYAFCEEGHAATVSAAIVKAQAAVPVEVVLRLGRDAVNVEGVKLAG